jgi:2-oxoglutarate ferredoxin oxidoreductase subunit beta
VGTKIEVVQLGNGISENDLLVHDEQGDLIHSFLLARMRRAEFPEPIGVFRDVQAPTFDDQMNDQIKFAKQKRGAGDLNQLFRSGDTWQVA